MNDQNQQKDPEHRVSRRFIKGVHRAFFSPVEPEDIVIPPPVPVQPAPVVPPVVSPPPLPVQPVVVPTPVVAPVQPVVSVSSPPTPVVTPTPTPITVPVQPIQQPVPVQQPISPVPAKKKKPVGKFLLFMFLGLLLAGVGGYTYYLYQNSQQEVSRLQSSPASITSLEVDAIVKRVGRHIELPSEQPTVRTLTGVDQTMRAVPFYTNAKDGDIVLAFSQRAILYDPTEDKIVEVGFIRQPTPEPSGPQTATNSGKIQMKEK